MYFFFDESGDYAFPEDCFDCYVQAVLICPGSQLERLELFVNSTKRDLGIEELHATYLEPGRLLEVAQFVGACRCQLLAHVTDTVLVTKEQIAEFRLDQAATITRNLDRYRAESTKGPRRSGPRDREVDAPSDQAGWAGVTDLGR